MCRIRFTSVLTCLAALIFVPSVWATTNTYSISGTSTGAGWSLRFTYCTSPPGVCISTAVPNCGPVPKGMECEALTAAFIECINMAFGPGGDIMASPVKGDPCSFTVTSNLNGALIMRVGPAGQDPDCEVDADGCSFNPTIVLTNTDAPPDPIPAVSEWGLVVTILLTLCAGTLVYRGSGLPG